MAEPKPLVVEAIDALKVGDRKRAVALLREDMARTTRGGDRWRSIANVAQKIGEIDIAIEAARRFAATTPPALERHLFLWGLMAEYGREEEVVAATGRLPDAVVNTAPVQHLLGTLAAGLGNKESAERHFRAAIAASPGPTTSWFPLSMIKRFEKDDPDFAPMEAMLAHLHRMPPEARARHHYALGKAYLDSGDIDRAMAAYEKGAAIRRTLEKFDAAAYARFADRIIETMDAAFFEKLTPSGHRGSRALFVNSVPRAGSTLMEQILVAHSSVSDGGEINLFSNALLPVMGRDADAALAYQDRADSDDPWGDIARTYEGLLQQRFPGDHKIVDKTLMQSAHVGLLMHAIPDARMIWVRRSPEDSAWSTYRNYFTSPLSWSWSFEDIGKMYRIEDRLFDHWTALFPERILVVDYEEFVADPASGISRILDHFELEDEAVLDQFRTLKRQVRTASVSQVREGITTDKVGQAAAIDRWLEPFRKAYRG